jgi:hypothetical protein
MKINFKSLGKAFKEVGITVGSVSAVAGLAMLQNPEVVAPILVAVGPAAPFVALGLQFGVKYALDALKHRSK